MKNRKELLIHLIKKKRWWWNVIARIKMVERNVEKNIFLILDDDKKIEFTG